MVWTKKSIVLLLSVFFAVTVECSGQGGDLLEFIPGILGNCPNCAPRLTIVNNCADNVELLWKVTDNRQWDFLLRQGAEKLYTNEATSSGDMFYRFKLGDRGATDAQKTFRIPEQGASSGIMYFMMACTPTSGSSWDTCKIGGVPFTTFFSAVPAYEPTFGCSAAITDRSLCSKNLADNTPLTAVDWFDISAVNYYAIPFQLNLIDSTGYSCNASGKPLSGIDAHMLDLASCPGEDSTTMDMTAADRTAYANTYSVMQSGFSLLSTGTDGTTNYNKVCAAPLSWLSTPGIGNPSQPNALTGSDNPINTFDWYGSVGTMGQALTSSSCVSPGCGGPQAYKGMRGDYTHSIPMTNYVKRLKELGYTEAYTWQYDDAAGNINCTQGVKTILTLCPQGGAPYSQSNAWWYDTSVGTNACVPVDASTPSGVTQYTSLFLCQQQGINRYALIKETLTSQNPSMGSQAIYYCTTYPATDGTTVYTYADCQTNVANCNSASTSGATLPPYCPNS